MKQYQKLMLPTDEKQKVSKKKNISSDMEFFRKQFAGKNLSAKPTGVDLSDKEFSKVDIKDMHKTVLGE